MQRKIVDSHIHFWDTNKLDYEWLSGLPALNKPYLPEQLSKASIDKDLEKMVFVQAGLPAEQGLAETEWVSELAKTDTRIKGIVAVAPLELGEGAKEYLDALQRYPLVKGVRRLIQGEALGFAKQEAFIEGVQLLSDYGFRFDLCIYHPQMQDIITLLEQCPNVSFVLDHVGKPDIKNGLMQPWAIELTSLASFSNVKCKLSGMVTEADHKNWQKEDLKPYADHVLASFGVDRIMYGGDWPVSELASNWLEWVETAEWLLADLSEADKQKVFYSNAIDFYGLD